MLRYLCSILGADLLVGARAVVFNPHFRYFSSQDVQNSAIGSVQSWPAGSPLLLRDSFEPTQSLREHKSWRKRRITAAWYGVYDDNFTSGTTFSISGFGLTISLLSSVLAGGSSPP